MCRHKNRKANVVNRELVLYAPKINTSQPYKTIRHNKPVEFALINIINLNHFGTFWKSVPFLFDVFWYYSQVVRQFSLNTVWNISPTCLVQTDVLYMPSRYNTFVVRPILAGFNNLKLMKFAMFRRNLSFVDDFASEILPCTLNSNFVYIVYLCLYSTSIWTSHE